MVYHRIPLLRRDPCSTLRKVKLKNSEMYDNIRVLNQLQQMLSKIKIVCNMVHENKEIILIYLSQDSTSE